ncbi:hypothetical protein NQ317_007514 [Molorchus minor]|uniref:Uncharacterized protein n=1 Tax=Molorchus minor TaxID=1323400 RepID=A0ABQ9J0Y5_9CUCU|nr:hypothetical protein NQ317_007514 [Molorchus minor]
MKKKRGWVKGRARGKLQNKTQLTLPEFIKTKLQKDSGSESLVSEKSDEETVKNVISTSTLEKRERIKTRKEDKMKRTSRISTEEDSSAEADDEMENDELPVPKDSPPNSKYKFTKDKSDMLRIPLKNNEKSDLHPKNGSDIKTSPILDKSKSPLYSTTSESELEIDGQKIKTISQKEVMENTLIMSHIKTTESNVSVITNRKEDKKEADVDNIVVKESETTFEKPVEIEEGRKSTDMEIEKFDDDNKTKIILKEPSNQSPPITKKKMEAFNIRLHTEKTKKSQLDAPQVTNESVKKTVIETQLNDNAFIQNKAIEKAILNQPDKQPIQPIIEKVDVQNQSPEKSINQNQSIELLSANSLTKEITEKAINNDLSVNISENKLVIHNEKPVAETEKYVENVKQLQNEKSVIANEKTIQTPKHVDKLIRNQPGENPVLSDQKPLQLDQPPISIPQQECKPFVEKHSLKDVKSISQIDQKPIKSCSQMENKTADVKPKEEQKIFKQEAIKPESKSKQEKIYDEKRYHQKMHEEKSVYDTQPKVHMDSESLLANAMATQNYHHLTQAQYQWQRDRLAWSIYYDTKRDYSGYPVLPQFPPLDMLAKQPSCEKEKIVSCKSHRHSSQSSSGFSSKSKDGSKTDKNPSPRKEDKTKLKSEQENYSQIRTSEASNKSSSCSFSNTQIINKVTNITPIKTDKSKAEQEEQHKIDESTQQQMQFVHYGQCELDVAQLGLESPASISSDMTSQNSVEPVRPPSVAISQQQPSLPQTNYDCSVQHNIQQQQQGLQSTVPTSSPNVNQSTTMQITSNTPQIHQNTSSKRPMQQQRSRSNTQSSKQHNVNRSTPPSATHVQQNRQRATPPSSSQQQLQHIQASPTTQTMQQHHTTQQLQPHLHHQVVHQGYQYQLGASMPQHPHHAHHHSVISQGNYIPVAVTTQAFPSQAASTYVNVPMTTVIQHRMSTQQKWSPSSTPTPVQASNSTQAASGNSSCSLAKLQQLTNGLDMIPPTSCNTMTPPPTAMTLTPPPTHHPHATMTPPPSHQMIQNQTVRNLTPPSAIPPNLQQQVLGYHKYYQTNMNVNQLSGAVTPPISQNLGRSGRNSANVAAMQHMQTSTSRVSPNVTLNPNVMYNMNSYRMAPQQAPGAVTGYITNTAAGFINNQIPMQMMNMAQTQYQDPAALQRAQQNTMYTAYINGIMQPLNGTMRR